MNQTSDRCARCGRAIDPEDRFTVRSHDGVEHASICRIEHLVAWVMRGARWQSSNRDAEPTAPVVLERDRAGTTTEVEFENVEKLREWASAGGPWARSTQ